MPALVVTGGTDLAMLERWLDRSLLVSPVEQLLTEPAPARRSGHPWHPRCLEQQRSAPMSSLEMMVYILLRSR